MGHLKVEYGKMSLATIISPQQRVIWTFEHLNTFKWPIAEDS